MGMRQKYTGGRLVFYNGEDSAIGQLLQLGRTATAALIMGGGTSASPLTKNTADKNFFGYWLKSSATSGTSRGLYQRLYLTGGAGGECIRAFTTVESNTPADTCNGIHTSLSFGSSAGNITGLGTALRGTLHIPNRALNGTVAAIQAEVYADGASSDIGGTCSLIRGLVDGDGTGKAACDSKVFLLDLTATDGSGEMVYRAQAEPTWTSKTCLIKCKINGNTTYLVGVEL